LDAAEEVTRIRKKESGRDDEVEGRSVYIHITTPFPLLHPYLLFLAVCPSLNRAAMTTDFIRNVTLSYLLTGSFVYKTGS
jgi:hypothetical protein